MSQLLDKKIDQVCDSLKNTRFELADRLNTLKRECEAAIEQVKAVKNENGIWFSNFEIVEKSNRIEMLRQRYFEQTELLRTLKQIKAEKP